MAAHVVAAEEQGEEALHNCIEQLELDVSGHTNEEEGGDDLVEALAVGHAAALAVPAAHQRRRAEHCGRHQLCGRCCLRAHRTA